jgi:hypothetical protein
MVQNAQVALAPAIRLWNAAPVRSAARASRA